MLITSSLDKKLIENYLNGEWPHQTLIGYSCISSFGAALREARNLTGRNAINGEIFDYSKSGNWAGACMYLILIDHMGEKFKKEGFLSKSTGAFLLALQNFTSLTKHEIEIIYQLRNSFLHQFNLYNLPQNKKFDPRHFVVHRGSPLITLPLVNFEGNLADINADNATLISLVEIGDMVEEMISNLKQLLTNDQLIVNTEIEGHKYSVVELLSANTFCYQANP